MNKKLPIVSFFAALMLLTVSCADEDLKPILTFDQVGKGAYVRLLELISGEYDLNNFDNSSYEYTIEFVDLEQGNLVSQYNLMVSFDDKDGTLSDPVQYRTWSSGDFTDNANGFKGLANIQIPIKDVASLFGLGLADLAAGDQFHFDGSVTTTDGRTFGFENSTAAVNGSAFAGHFDFTVKATCPLPDTDWVGDYQISYDNGVPADGFGPIFGAEPPVVTLTTVSGSTTRRQFGWSYLPDSYNFDGQVGDMDFVCVEIVLSTMDTGVGCGGGNILIGQDGPSPVADLSDDSSFRLKLIDYQSDGGCGVDPIPVDVTFTKQ